MQSKPTTVLLVVIAALLAANLFVTLPPQEATAQSHLNTPHVIQVEPGAGNNPRIYRLWSDGVIEEAVFGYSNPACVPDSPGFGWQEIPESVPPPPARIVRLYPELEAGIFLRLRSDGVVERNDLVNGSWCGWRTPPE